MVLVEQWRRFVGWPLILLASGLSGAVKPASLFSDHAVLQRDQLVPVWGSGESGETVTITFAGQSITTQADQTGQWKAFLAPLAANPTGQDLLVTGKDTVTVRDVCVGDVWLVSGQSNMAWKLSQDAEAALELPGAERQHVRQFYTHRTIASSPAATVVAAWSRPNSTSAGDFSAVAWYFATAVQHATGVTVGVINATWGNTPIEAWLPASTERPLSTLVTTEPYQKASVLFQGMVHPLAPYALHGFLWYQGESNISNPDEYAQLFPTLITSWRATFKQGNRPFYWVQLPRFKADHWDGLEWPRLREAQDQALTLPATGRVVALDLGDVQDIHPRRKRDVGLRLARLALHRSYGLNVTDSGPEFAGAVFSGATARVNFIQSSSPLHSSERALHGFELAGNDRKFYPAEAHLEGAEVLVSSADVPAPQAVRYAWRNAPEIGLFNEDGLPAAPFRSDRW